MNVNKTSKFTFILNLSTNFDKKKKTMGNKNPIG